MDYKTKIKNIKESCEIVKTNNDAIIFVSSLIFNNFVNKNMVFIAKNDVEMEKFKNQIEFFSPNISQTHEIILFNAWDCQPYDKNSPKQLISTNRIKSLYKLSNQTDKKIILITSVNSILQKVIAPKLVKNSSLIAKIGDKLSTKDVIDFLIFNGYQRQSSAYIAGEFAVRGGIIDIVINKAAMSVGYRIDFFGDEIDSIKEFDPISQISSENVKEIEILPASEVVLNDETVNNFRQNYRNIFSETFNLNHEDPLYEAISNKRQYPGMEHYLPLFYQEKLVNILSYLDDPLIFFNNEINHDIKNHQEKCQEYYLSRIEDITQSRDSQIYNPLKPDYLYFKTQEFNDLIKDKISIIFNNFDSQNKDSRIINPQIKECPDFALAAKANKKDAILLLKEYLSANPKKTIIGATNENSQDKISKLLKDNNIEKPIVKILIDKGFESSDLLFIGEEAIFGEKKHFKKSKKNQEASKKILEEGLTINVGELVVHRDYGIGKFDGIHKIEAANIKNDMIKIIYGGNDTLFVPVEDVNLITRYGSDNPLIELDKLGVSAWKNRKNKVKKRIKIAAEKLINIAAQRHVKKAPIFIANDDFYDDFKNKFGFVETQDQLSAIEDIEEDLAKGSPMDRLICGDVGFGKTEVAMRAAFIVASSNYEIDLNEVQQTNIEQNDELDENSIIRTKNLSQIAIITPTTLLCRQHYKNFKERFAKTNIKIKQLSRLTTQTQNRQTKKELENGEIDIIIGTHSLLAKNIKFKNLALIIIDEEQHFGVAQKERLKELRSEVHIITLSATPIPRTLQMSLTGVKELSLIATPPVDRLAVRNFVMTYDAKIVKEAIMREYQRSGKVFFVVPRVKYIAEIEEKLKKSLPEEIKIKHAHGQMTPSELDDIMNEFYDDKIDILLSTTIIESGIDIASANTIIIYKAEMFGLAQLYQLRGRVGRSKTRGYAYFMLSDKKLKPESKKKLDVMQHLDELGVGFTVASHDMDIRGSGDILGDEQSGHIKETGIELYQQMLLDEIEKQKNKNLQQNNNQEINDFEFNPQIKLGVSLIISEDYIQDLSLRMSFYKKIANIKDQEEQENLENEMLDRFGKIPQETKNLIAISLLKQQCRKLKIEKLESRSQGILITFYKNKFKEPEKLLQLVVASNSQIKLTPDHKVLFVNSSNKAKIDFSSQILEQLSNI